MWYIHIGTVSWDKKEYHIQDMLQWDKFPKHYAEWKKWDTKEHVLFDYTCIEYPEEANP